MTKKKRLIPATIIFLVLTSSVLFIIYWLSTAMTFELVTAHDGFADMRGFAFDSKVAHVIDQESFPGKLLHPTEIDNHTPEGWDASLGTKTVRVRVAVPDGNYIVFGKTPEYASRIFINGELAGTFGYIDEHDSSNNTYQVAMFDFAAQPDDGIIEVVFNIAGFIRPILGYHSFFIGQYNIASSKLLYDMAYRLIPLVFFLAIALFYLGYFLFVPKSLPNLWLALIAILLGFFLSLHTKIAFTFLPMLGYQFEYFGRNISMLVIFMFYVLFMRSMFRIPKAVVITSGATVVLLIVMFLSLPIRVSAGYISLAVANMAVFAAICSVFALIKIKQWTAEHFLSFFGQAVFVVTSVLDMRGYTHFYELDLSVMGMLILVFAQIAALYLRNNRVVENEQRLAMEKQQAEAASKAKSDFLSMMSHEIRTPMNAIIGVSSIELENENNPPETTTAFDMINSSGKMLLGIINDILDLSKIETGKLELIPVAYDTSSFISDTVRLNAMRIGDKPLKFTVKVAETLPAVLFGDELRLKQILNNVLSNAIKYTERGNITFEIDSQSADDAAVLIFTVRDTGQGMTKEQLELLYDKYTMFNQETNRMTEGTGLGMSITKNLVEMMGGKIEVESKPGAGSVFTVHIPQCLENDQVLGKEAAEKLQNFTLSEKTQRKKIIREYMPYGNVLIVDDVDANLFVAKGLMKPYGLAIETVLSGYKALNKIGENNVYDIIFMDHMMPEMDGIETTKRLREAGYSRPIIALTANAVVGQKEMFLESGFDDFISKPIDARQLDSILIKYIRDKQPPEVLEEARRQKQKGGSLISDGYTDGNTAVQGSSGDIIAALKSIDALNVDSALDAMVGLHDVYIDTVKLTARLLPGRIEKMDRYIESDINAFTVEVHGLKSVLRNIGANVSGRDAERLEKAASENDIAYCKEHYPPFKASLIELESKLSAAFPAKKADEKEGADITALVKAALEAKSAAEAYDRDTALACLSPHADFAYGTEIDGLLKEIILALEAFDCESAVKSIITMEEFLNATI